MDNMTAKVSCFARAYHYKNNATWIFKDEVAEKILGEKEYQAIADNMAEGIAFFAPEFEGTKEDALAFIVEHQLAPSVLGRSAFCERHLQNEIRLGAEQYIIFASGYDTFAYRNKCEKIKIFELDLPQMLAEKSSHEKESFESEPNNRVMIPCNLEHSSWKADLEKEGYRKEKKTFGSLLGITYYLEKERFRKWIENISDCMSVGSAICLDFPCYMESEETKKNENLAKEAGESMKAKYSIKEMEEILSENGFLVYEHIGAKEMTEQYFEAYNKATGKAMSAPLGVEYVLAVKR